MLFNSIDFLFVYLPIVLFGSVLIRRFAPQASIWFVTITSLAFYGAHNLRLVPLICASIAFNFVLGRHVYRANSARLLALGVIVNLLVLGYFKYYVWFAETAHAFGIQWLPINKIALPLAISFFTFEQISYLVDCKQRKIKPATFEDYAFFVAFFPKLIAGPIVRYSEIQPQFAALKKRISANAFASGSALFILGLCKKVVFADQAARIADPVFAASATALVNQAEAVIGVIAYTFQIYFDFSAYSDMAIGLAIIFGLKLPLNFSSPYKSTSIIEFWRRWHMTLSRFLRDYLYIPLGGNRRGPTSRMVNLLIVMLLGGLWHGAGITFVIWGALHGVYLIINHQFRALISDRLAERLWFKISSWLITMAAVAFAWIFFRSGAIDASFLMIHSIVSSGPDAASPLSDIKLRAILTIVGLAAVCAMPNSNEIIGYRRLYHAQGAETERQPDRWFTWRPNAAWGAALGLCIVAAALLRMNLTPFIYFQF